MRLNEENHWSTVVINDLIQVFANQHKNDPLWQQINQQIANLFESLGDALTLGHTVVTVPDTLLAELQKQQLQLHPLVAILPNSASSKLGDSYPVDISHKPIIIQNDLAYIHRQWWQEHTLAQKIHTLLSFNSQLNPSKQLNTDNPPHVDLSHLPSSMHPLQKQAIIKAMNSQLLLITGGPGTGKTWTVSKLVLTLLQQNPALKIALAAPTGKAAQRMQEALYHSLTDSASTDLMALVKQQIDQAKTIHRLLGLGYHRKPRFDADKPLPYDLVIIDEASMLGVALANQLMLAIAPQTKVIFLGDANQLAAVEAGAVLADLCHADAMKAHHIALTESKRFDGQSGIGLLAAAVLQNNQQEAQQLLQNHADIQHTTLPTHDNAKNHASVIYQAVCQPYAAYFEYLKTRFTAEQMATDSPQTLHQAIKELFIRFDSYRILAATRHGYFGINRLNQFITQALKQTLALPISKNVWFHGRPVMVLVNNPALKLSNGDIGICLKKTDGYYIYFPHIELPISASRFAQHDIDTAFAMTIHKSQGSEFERVAMILDDIHANSQKQSDQTNQLSENSMISKELIYTAITRAKKQIDVYANMATFYQGMQTQANRQTGLGTLLR